MEFVMGLVAGMLLMAIIVRASLAMDRFLTEKVEPYGVQGKNVDVFVKRTRRHVDLPHVRPVVKQASIRSTATERSEA